LLGDAQLVVVVLGPLHGRVDLAVELADRLALLGLVEVELVHLPQRAGLAGFLAVALLAVLEGGSAGRGPTATRAEPGRWGPRRARGQATARTADRDAAEARLLARAAARVATRSAGVRLRLVRLVEILLELAQALGLPAGALVVDPGGHRVV